MAHVRHSKMSCLERTLSVFPESILVPDGAIYRIDPEFVKSHNMAIESDCEYSQFVEEYIRCFTTQDEYSDEDSKYFIKQTVAHLLRTNGGISEDDLDVLPSECMNCDFSKELETSVAFIKFEKSPPKWDNSIMGSGDCIWLKRVRARLKIPHVVTLESPDREAPKGVKGPMYSGSTPCVVKPSASPEECLRVLQYFYREDGKLLTPRNAMMVALTIIDHSQTVGDVHPAIYSMAYRALEAYGYVVLQRVFGIDTVTGSITLPDYSFSRPFVRSATSLIEWAKGQYDVPAVILYLISKIEKMRTLQMLRNIPTLCDFPFVTNVIEEKVNCQDVGNLLMATRLDFEDTLPRIPSLLVRIPEKNDICSASNYDAIHSLSSDIQRTKESTLKSQQFFSEKIKTAPEEEKGALIATLKGIESHGTSKWKDLKSQHDKSTKIERNRYSSVLGNLQKKEAKKDAEEDAEKKKAKKKAEKEAEKEAEKKAEKAAPPTIPGMKVMWLTTIGTNSEFMRDAKNLPGTPLFYNCIDEGGKFNVSAEDMSSFDSIVTSIDGRNLEKISTMLLKWQKYDMFSDRMSDIFGHVMSQCPEVTTLLRSSCRFLSRTIPHEEIRQERIQAVLASIERPSHNAECHIPLGELLHGGLQYPIYLCQAMLKPGELKRPPVETYLNTPGEKSKQETVTMFAPRCDKHKTNTTTLLPHIFTKYRDSMEKEMCHLQDTISVMLGKKNRIGVEDEEECPCCGDYMTHETAVYPCTGEHRLMHGVCVTCMDRMSELSNFENGTTINWADHTCCMCRELHSVEFTTHKHHHENIIKFVETHGQVKARWCSRFGCCDIVNATADMCGDPLQCGDTTEVDMFCELHKHESELTSELLISSCPDCGNRFNRDPNTCRMMICCLHGTHECMGFLCNGHGAGTPFCGCHFIDNSGGNIFFDDYGEYDHGYDYPDYPDEGRYYVGYHQKVYLNLEEYNGTSKSVLKKHRKQLRRHHNGKRQRKLRCEQRSQRSTQRNRCKK